MASGMHADATEGHLLDDDLETEPEAESSPMLASPGRARFWAKAVGGGGLSVGLVATFYFSVAVEGSGDRAKDLGLTIAACMVAMTLVAAVTGARVAYDWISALSLPEPRRELAKKLTMGAVLGGMAVAGLTLAVFSIAFGVEAGDVSKLSRYALKRVPTVGFFEVLVAVGLGSAVAMSVSRTWRAAPGAIEPPSRDFVLRRLGSVIAGTVTLFAIPFAAIQFAERDSVQGSFSLSMLILGAIAGAIVMFVTKPHSDMARAMAAERADARGDATVRQALSEMRRASRRRAVVGVLSATLGVSTAVVGIYALELMSAELPRAEQPGLMSFFAAIAVGVMVALLAKKKFAATVEADPVEVFGGAPVGGIFDDSLATTSSLTVRQQRTLGGLLFGDVAGQKFELVDGGGAWCGSAHEQSNLFARIFFTARRPLTIAVDDVGETALRVTRPFVLWHEEASVTAGDRVVGLIRRTWFPLRAVYRVVDSKGNRTFTLTSGWIFKSRYRISKDGQQVGELRRLRKPWYLRWLRSSLIPEQDRFAVTFPTDADMDGRRLLVGALFLIDASS